MAAYRKQIRVTYSVKNDEGLLVEKRLKFPTIHDAYTFIKLISQSPVLMGKPILEYK